MKISSWITVALIAFLQACVGQCYGQSTSQPRRITPKASSPQASYVSPDAFSWHTVVARDATFRLQLPVSWHEVGPETLESFQAMSEQGESMVSGMLQVYTNRDVLRPNLVANQSLLSRVQLVLMSRLLSAPLTPTEVVTKLFPQIAHGAIQNVRIVQTHMLPSAPGGLSALLLYQYTLFPRRDAAYLSQLPPTLRNQTKVQMGAWATISTDQGNGLTWGLTYGIIAAPLSVFRSNQAIYVRIGEKYEFIPEGLVQKVRSNIAAQQLAAQLNENTRRATQMMADDDRLLKSGLGIAGALGGDTTFRGPRGVEGKLPTRDVQPNTRYVICYETGPTPIPETSAPLGAHCTPVQ
jgi:hypothetical protein